MKFEWKQIVGKASLIVLLLFLAMNCFAQEAVADSTQKKPKITFLELGSTTCIPCKQMEPVLEAIRSNYGDQIEVIFYDVKLHRDVATQYNIRMIPTQIFLDAEGNELFRHVGFYSEQQIDEFLQKQGLTKRTEPQN